MENYEGPHVPKSSWTLTHHCSSRPKTRQCSSNVVYPPLEAELVQHTFTPLLNRFQQDDGLCLKNIVVKLLFHRAQDGLKSRWVEETVPSLYLDSVTTSCIPATVWLKFKSPLKCPDGCEHAPNSSKPLLSQGCPSAEGSSERIQGALSMGVSSCYSFNLQGMH